MSPQTPPTQANNPLHGLTLKAILEHLVEELGWTKLADEIRIRCFAVDPSLDSSLKFLRRTSWARAKVEDLYLSHMGFPVPERSVRQPKEGASDKPSNKSAPKPRTAKPDSRNRQPGGDKPSPYSKRANGQAADKGKKPGVGTKVSAESKNRGGASAHQAGSGADKGTQAPKRQPTLSLKRTGKTVTADTQSPSKGSASSVPTSTNADIWGKK
ncbi:VF530 family DNA-binding protein [Shewanella sp. FJAT-52076]|uniref:VF530 family protein n=1 Tax=Shewanella sp. FJAT-52076 TaxID=2864202 RepID=UPI001C656C9A|nr:VF530 family protein [Shewanella sp. FJAT-52076]